MESSVQRDTTAPHTAAQSLGVHGTLAVYFLTNRRVCRQLSRDVWRPPARRVRPNLVPQNSNH